jgi:hypothetical protein
MRLGALSRGVVAATAGLALAWTLPTSCGLVLAKSMPGAARQFAPRNAAVLSAIATRDLYTGTDMNQLSTIAADARQALRSSPIETEALRDLAIIDVMQGDDDRARVAFSLVGSSTRRDYQSHAWLYADALDHKDYRKALSEADIVLRQGPSPSSDFLSGFIQAAHGTPIAGMMVPLLAGKPPWRFPYLTNAGKIGDPDTTYRIFMGLRQRGAPASTQELGPYFLRGMLADNPRKLLDHWQNIVLGEPAGSGVRINDPDFNGLDAPPPFNWTLYNHDSSYSEIAPNPEGGGTGLHASFSESDVYIATQALVLEPGAFRLSGQVYSEGATDQSVIELRLLCGINGTGAQIGTVQPATRQNAWARFSLDFTVPAGCIGQRLLIRGGSGDRINPASYWVDKLTLVQR